MNLQNIKPAYAVLGFILVVTAYQALTTEVIAPPNYPTQDAICYGTPIVVDYEYGGAMMQPHACKVQCDTKTPHYIIYSNNKGTQCGAIPDCSDWGEDNGVTCILQ